ncbi:hypothetical protein [Breoghania sp.]|uniref:hypothetical protein n=2 Tax=Breoghania sp. TaxID=2065378 RepID=UPI0029CAA26C|nr:hypothetical protein [Breoghania sp.]
MNTGNARETSRRFSPAFHFRSPAFFAKNKAMTDIDDTEKDKLGSGAAKCAPEKPSSAKQAKRSSREERLAAALRANLKRRKEQQRERKSAAQDGDPTDS